MSHDATFNRQRSAAEDGNDVKRKIVARPDRARVDDRPADGLRRGVRGKKGRQRVVRDDVRHAVRAEQETVARTHVREAHHIRLCGCARALDGTRDDVPLRMARGLLGRKSSTTEAAIAIETSDRTMSRSHARIDVRRDRRGNLIHTLSDCQSKNHTLYNGTPLGAGETVVLKDNDELRLGRTTLRFNF